MVAFRYRGNLTFFYTGVVSRYRTIPTFFGRWVVLRHRENPTLLSVGYRDYPTGSFSGIEFSQASCSIPHLETPRDKLGGRSHPASALQLL